MGASLLLAELLFVLAGLYGVWLMSQPVSYVVSGILGLIAVERVQAHRDERKLHARIRAVAKRHLPGGKAA